MVEQAAKEGWGIYLLGGKPGVAQKAADKLKEKYPRALFVGTHDGYFQKENEENDAVVEEINNSGAVILFVCLGVPTQEKWIDANRERLPNVRLAMGLGGSLDGSFVQRTARHRTHAQTAKIGVWYNLVPPVSQKRNRSVIHNP